MANSRHFTNKLPDYVPGEDVTIRKETFHPLIQALVQEIVTVSDAVVKTTDGRRLMKAYDGGLYTGQAGIAYMLWYVSTHYLYLQEFKSQHLTLATTILQQNLDIVKRTESNSDAVSFLCGSSGVYMLGALLGHSLKNETMMAENVKKFTSLFSKADIANPNFLKSCGGDELLVGRAGYLCGAFNLERKLGVRVLNDDVKNAICVAMYKKGLSGRSQSCPLMYAYYGTEYLGAAHGLSSILQMMISCPSFITSDPNVASYIKASVDWLLSTQQPNGNFVPATDELSHSHRSEQDQLVHWCHGAPGVIYLFAKAYKLWRDERYLQACLKCGDVTWEKGLLKKGPGICHGVAGNGYVFLVLYQLTGDKKHLHRAQQFAQFMLTEEFWHRARTPDCPYSLFEGKAGLVCFLVDLLQPDKAEFPFFSIL